MAVVGCWYRTSNDVADTKGWVPECKDCSQDTEWELLDLSGSFRMLDAGFFSAGLQNSKKLAKSSHRLLRPSVFGGRLALVLLERPT